MTKTCKKKNKLKIISIIDVYRKKKENVLRVFDILYVQELL